MIKKGYIYFIESENKFMPDEVLNLKIGKIGHRESYNCKINQYDIGKIINRKKELQIASAFNLRYLALLRVTSNVGRAERYIHLHINDFNYVTKMNGEWYYISRSNLSKLLDDVKTIVIILM